VPDHLLALICILKLRMVFREGQSPQRLSPREIINKPFPTKRRANTTGAARRRHALANFRICRGNRSRPDRLRHLPQALASGILHTNAARGGFLAVAIVLLILIAAFPALTLQLPTLALGPAIR